MTRKNELSSFVVMWEIGEIVDFNQQAQKQTEAKLLEKFRTKTTKAFDGVKEELKGAGWMKSYNEVSDSPFRYSTHENRASMPLLSRFTYTMRSVTMWQVGAISGAVRQHPQTPPSSR
jgi:hypothetical protein